MAETADWGRDAHGSLEPFARLICRAITVAENGADASEDVRAYPAESEALAALQRHEIDVAVGVTPGFTAASGNHVAFGPVIFWDSLGFLVRADVPATSATALSGKRVCFIEGSPAEKILRARLPTALRLPFQEQGEMEDALEGGECQAVAADMSRLAQIKRRLSHAGLSLLDARLSLDPVSVATRQDDARLSGVVGATVQVLLLAEASGVTSAHAAAVNSDDPDMQFLSGADWASAQALGLAHDYPAQIIAAVGNYGEIFAGTIDLPRGLNAMWLHGGLLAPLPLR